MTFRDSVAAIAQGAINIDHGQTTIEAGSRVYRGMHELCRLLTEHPAVAEAMHEADAADSPTGA
jgi:hypothetical protein